MRRNGLSTKDFKTFNAGLGATHRRRIRVDVLTLSGKLIGTLPVTRVIGGTFTGDAGGGPGLMGISQLELFDPQRKLSFDPADSDRPLHRTRQLRIWDCRKVDGLDEWVEDKAHVGPIFDVDRDGPLVTVVVHDKSEQMGANAGNEETYNKGRRRSEVQKQIAVNTGEKRSRMDIPATKGRLPKKMTVLRMDIPWQKAKSLGPGRRLFYSGEVLRSRPDPKKPSVTWGRRMVLSNAKLDRTAKERPLNTVIFKGGKPKGKNTKRVVSPPQYLPKNHKDSPQSLGRNGRPRKYIKQVENEKIKSRKVAINLAKKARDDLALSTAEQTVSMIPFSHGEFGDLHVVPTPSGGVRIRQVRWTMSYGPDGDMELGANRRTGAPLKRPQNKKPPKRRKRGGGK